MAVVQAVGAASPAARQLIAHQRRLLAMASAAVAGYYVTFGAAGIYPPHAAALGTFVPLLFAASMWGLSAAPGRESAVWLSAITAGASALAVGTAWLSARTACVGFHVVVALPLVYSVLVPYSLAACLSGSAVALGGGLAMLVADGHPAAQAAQWAAIGVGMTAFAARRIVHARRALATIRAEERAATARLAESERRYRLVAENALDVIWALDPATARLTYVSPAVQPLLGYSQEEVLRLPLPEVLTPDALDRALTLLGLVGTPAEPPGVSTTLEHVCRDGSRKPVEITARVVRGEGGRIEIVGVSRDVSERRRLEAQVREAHKLESVGRLAGGVAHDFNNLLTVILSLSSAMIEDLETGGALAREDALQIRAAAERGRELVRQLLAFAQRQVVEPVLLDLGEAIAASAPLLAKAAGDAVRVEVRSEGGPFGVRCDRGGLDEALVNLALNARDAMPGGGTLRVEVSTARVAAGAMLEVPGLTPGTWVRLRVEDTGAGMTPEVLSHAFEPFFTTKPPGQGTGLGLATVHGVVSQCGGRVHVESAPGQGARFDLFFPSQPLPPPAGTRDEEPPEPAAGGETVLVVEDDDLLRAVTVRVLQGAGFRVLAAAGGPEALAHATCEPGPLHLALVDVVMPGMSGLEVAAELRRRRPETAILYVSGARDGIARHAAVDRESPLLAKPFTPDTLLAAVRARLRGVGPGAAPTLPPGAA